MCGIRFEANVTHFSAEACSESCWEALEDIKRHHFRQRVLRIAELDPCPELDLHLAALANSDVVIDRYSITGKAYSYFKGPQPHGWPEDVRLNFPIATFERKDHPPRRVFGLKAIVDLIAELAQPCFMPTKKFTKRVDK